ncbi:MAG: hypothetical protein ACOC32_03710 [Nanoarchaeota archaeon]
MIAHFRNLWHVIRHDNSKLEASPILFWFFTPVLVGSTVANWFDLRLFLGTVAWCIVSYAFGQMIITWYKRRTQTILADDGGFRLDLLKKDIASR